MILEEGVSREISGTGFASIAFGYPNALWEPPNPICWLYKVGIFAQDKRECVSGKKSNYAYALCASLLLGG